MAEKILERFVYEDIHYIIGTNKYNFYSYNIDWPWVMITNKSSKRKRGKSNDKRDAHFLRIDVKEPIKLTRKVLTIFEQEYINSDFLIVSAHNDYRRKRERLYLLALEKLGFKLFKEFRYYKVLINNNIKVKNKIIKELQNLLE